MGKGISKDKVRILILELYMPKTGQNMEKATSRRDTVKDKQLRWKESEVLLPKAMPHVSTLP